MPDSPKYNELEITTCLVALAAWAGNAKAASSYLENQKDIRIPASTLNQWKLRFSERYDKIRSTHQNELEGRMVHEMREVSGLALDATRLAVEKAVARLEANKDEDPGRTAANLARVSQSSTDKMLSLSGRPTQITETRNAADILRSLAAKGVLKFDEPPQLEAPDG